MTKPKVGRPLLLTEDLMHTILACIEKGDAIPGQVAAFAGITPHLLRSWLRAGANDIQNGQDSIYAQFSTQYRKKCADVIKEFVVPLKECARNWQSNLELLKVCARNDFRPELEAMEKMAEEIAELKRMMMSYQGNGDAFDVKVDDKKA